MKWLRKTQTLQYRGTSPCKRPGPCLRKWALGSGRGRVKWNQMDSSITTPGWVWLLTPAVNWGSGSICEVCARVQCVVFMQLISPECTSLGLPQWFSCIKKHYISVMLKLFPNISITLEQIHTFSASLRAELTTLIFQKIKEWQEIDKLS